MARCILSMPTQRVSMRVRHGCRGQSVHTLMTQVHLDLEGLELFRQAGAGLCAHLLVGPLLEAVELLVDVHGGGRVGVQ